MMLFCRRGLLRSGKPKIHPSSSSSSILLSSISPSLSLSSYSSSSSSSSASSIITSSSRGFFSQIEPLRQQKEEISDFPGAQSRYTTELHIDTEWEPHPVYRVMDADGRMIEKNAKPSIPDEDVVTMYKHMVELNTMDTIFYESQRQGRISFYMTNYGEEAAQIGSSSALDFEDVIFPQYREAGVLMWRGFTLEMFANQCFSNQYDLGKGRQMPVHYGSRELHIQTVSSPLATQIPQAAGYAYALKREGKPNVVICYFGEGAASEGDFHVALNFASTLDCPALFFCRNNGYAISTASREQYRGDGIISRAPGYGVACVRVDGNDLFAVHEVTAAARQYAVENNRPVMIEAMTYRGGHHSTSDDSSRYRTQAEIDEWNAKNNPITRTRKYLESRNLWDADKENTLRQGARQDVLTALSTAEKIVKPAQSQLFTDIYDTVDMPSIQSQIEKWNEHMAKYGKHYPGTEVFAAEEDYEDPAKLL